MALCVDLEEATYDVHDNTARAEALFGSGLPTGSSPAPCVVEQAIRETVRELGGVPECVAYLAGEYGDHPETAAPRMSWARRVVELTYGAC